jgi:ketosteroid isomerase-like protein
MTDAEYIRQQIGKLAEAIRTMSIDDIEQFYDENIVSFDVEPPLKHVGLTHKLENWRRVFSCYTGPLEYEVHDLTIIRDRDVAFTHSFNRISGTLTSGAHGDHWLRSTNCFLRTEGRRTPS